MRKIIVSTFVSLDGVMHAPGGPSEDTSDNFTLGGWTVPYFDAFIHEVMDRQMAEPFDLLLGRKTFEIFAAFFPNAPEAGGPINAATKYVVSNTLTEHSWEKSVFLSGDVVSKIAALKAGDGPDLHVSGSSVLVQTLLKADLVDALWLMIFPVTLGSGKRLFGEGTIPAAFTLAESKASPSGVIVANYTRAGALKTGTF